MLTIQLMACGNSEMKSEETAKMADIIELQSDEIEILSKMYVNEERIQSGNLFSYQRDNLERYRYAKVYLLEKDLTKEQVCKVLKMAADERSNGVSVCVATMNKNKKFQKQQFNSQGYTEFKEFFKDSFDK